MAVTWTIVGEAGKAIDATSRTLEQLAISNAKMDFRSLQADEFTFSIYPQSLSGATIPDLKQKIVLYRDAGAGPQRFFTGHVTNVRSVISAGSEVCNVTVSGPWWWMERINFTSEIPINTAGTDKAERMTAIFGDDNKGGDLGVSLVKALNRSAALGVPFYADNSIDPNTPGWFYVLGQVRCVRVQSDLKIVCAGDFTSANGITVSKMVRFNEDGTIDTSFSCAVTDNIGTFEIDSSGNFHLGLLTSGYKKISSTGSVIYSTATDAQILDLKIQSDGKILIGGKFTTVAGTSKIGIARLNANSTLDTGFTGPTFKSGGNKWVRSIAISTTGEIYIGGEFMISSNRFCLTKLTSVGADDISFQMKNVTKAFSFSKWTYYPYPSGTAITGQAPFISSIKIQSDGMIVVSGGFILVTNVCSQIARFYPSGVWDNTLASSLAYEIISLDIKENSQNPTARLFIINDRFVTSEKDSKLNVSNYWSTGSGFSNFILGTDGIYYGCRLGTSSESGLVELAPEKQIARYSPNYSSIGVASFFQVPRITLNQSTCAEIISELVRLCPDAMVYFDYSYELPRCNITRRGVCSTNTISIGSSPVTNIDVSPIVELKVSEVKLPYIIRNKDGSKTYASQDSGSPINGESQIITVSGKELDTFLPNDKLNSFSITGTTTDFYRYLLENSSSVKDEIISKTGAGMYNYMQIGGVFSGYSSYWQSSYAGFAGSSYGTSWSINYGGVTAYNLNGIQIPASGLITNTNSIPSYAAGEGVSIQQITLKGVLCIDFPVWYHQFSGGSGTDRAYSCPCDPSLLNGFSKTSYYNAYDVVFGITTYNLLTKDISATAYLITGYTPGSTVYEKGEYSFAFPPAGLSANLLAAQNWLPYEGTIELVEQDVGAVRYRGTKVNVAGSTSALSSMGALVASESLDLGSGTTSIQLGCAPRLDYRTFVSKIRKTSQDNIIYI